MRAPSGVSSSLFAIQGQALTHIHLVVLVHRAGVGHVLEDEIQQLPVPGGNGQPLLASALHHTVWDVNEGVECPQRRRQGDLGWVKYKQAKCKEGHTPSVASRLSERWGQRGGVMGVLEAGVWLRGPSLLQMRQMSIKPWGLVPSSSFFSSRLISWLTGYHFSRFLLPPTGSSFRLRFANPSSSTGPPRGGFSGLDSAPFGFLF